MELNNNSQTAGRHGAGPRGVGGSQNRGGIIDQAAAAPAGVAGACGGGVASAVAGGTGGAFAGYGGGSAARGSSSQSARGKKRHHTPEQINAMNEYFKDHQHPDQLQRIELATRIGLDPEQVMAWFQNKRSQRKTQSEREGIEVLRSENEVLLAKKQHLGEAVRRNTWFEYAGCRTQLSSTGNILNIMRMENVRLKEKMEMFNSALATYIAGHNAQNFPLTHQQNLPLTHPQNLPGPNSNNVPVPNELRQNIHQLVLSATEELKAMAMAAEPLWSPSSADGSTSELTCEISRHTATVSLNPKQMLDILMDVKEWSSIFSAIVARALTVDILSVGENYNAALQLIAAEFHIPTPLIPNRECFFARYTTHQSESDGVWAVVDVSLDNVLPTPGIKTCKKKPSGCLIQDMFDGTSQITWIEHVYADNNGVSTMCKRLLTSALGFGAKRWVSTLQRHCQHFAVTFSSNTATTDFHNLVISSPEARTGILKISEGMVKDFLGGITGPKAGKWTELQGHFGDNVRLMSRRVKDYPGLRNGALLSASTSFTLPVPPNMVFNYFRSNRSRVEWDWSADGNAYQLLCHISFSEEAGSGVTVYRVPGQEHNLVLQESWRDPVASHIVFAPAKIANMKVILGGGDPNSLPLVPSGFTIFPDGPALGTEGSGGTLLTASYQVPYQTVDVDDASSFRLAQLVRLSCERIKVALQTAVGPITRTS